jgi:hypothetical protein
MRTHGGIGPARDGPVQGMGSHRHRGRAAVRSWCGAAREGGRRGAARFVERRLAGSHRPGGGSSPSCMDIREFLSNRRPPEITRQRYKPFKTAWTVDRKHLVDTTINSTRYRVVFGLPRAVVGKHAPYPGRKSPLFSDRDRPLGRTRSAIIRSFTGIDQRLQQLGWPRRSGYRGRPRWPGGGGDRALWPRGDLTSGQPRPAGQPDLAVHALADHPGLTAAPSRPLTARDSGIRCLTMTAPDLPGPGSRRPRTAVAARHGAGRR